MTRRPVYFVGAGPGAPGLLTVRGREILSSAEVVLYDGLVGRGVVALIPRGAQKLRVAKGPRHRDRFPQSKINELLIQAALAGKRVVRLKGGDALLFSRGGEEAQALRARGIPFEIVPGIPSALAGPAFAGIPLTERGLASSVAIVTGRTSSSAHHPPVNWSALGRGADTLVILMGVARWKQIAHDLLKSGRDPSTPVAAIRWATTARQRTTLFTLREASRPTIEARLESPSVLVVGATVVHAWRLNWYPMETRWASPLFLKLVARTRREFPSVDPEDEGHSRSAGARAPPESSPTRRGTRHVRRHRQKPRGPR